MKVAFIGLGSMGKPMAANIAKAGHELFVIDSDASQAAKVAADIGARALHSVSEVPAVDVVVTMLPDGNSVRAVALGEGGLATTLKAGTIVVDMSSSQPLLTQETAAALAAKGIVLIDAPVSGGVERATRGTLTIMIGTDDPAAVERAQPVLSCMGNRFFTVGKSGSGHVAKTLNNVVAACNFAVLAEALIVADRYGIDRETLVDIVNVSTGQSFASSVVAKQCVVTKGYNTGFKVGLLSKDVSIAAEFSAGLGCNTPIIHATDARWIEARDMLGPLEDHSRAIDAWAKESVEK